MSFEVFPVVIEANSENSHRYTATFSSQVKNQNLRNTVARFRKLAI